MNEQIPWAGAAGEWWSGSRWLQRETPEHRSVWQVGGCSRVGNYMEEDKDLRLGREKALRCRSGGRQEVRAGSSRAETHTGWGRRSRAGSGLSCRQ